MRATPRVGPLIGTAWGTPTGFARPWPRACRCLEHHMSFPCLVEDTTHWIMADLPPTTRSLSALSDCRCVREYMASRKAKPKTVPPRDSIAPNQPSIDSFMRATTTTGNSQRCYSNLTKASLYCYNLWHLYFVMYIRARSNILAAPPHFSRHFIIAISPIINTPPISLGIL